MVRFSTLGKGTLTLQPFHSDRSLMNVAAAAALISSVTAALDPRGLILAKSHYLLYSIVPAIQVLNQRVLASSDSSYSVSSENCTSGRKDMSETKLT